MSTPPASNSSSTPPVSSSLESRSTETPLNSQLLTAPVVPIIDPSSLSVFEWRSNENNSSFKYRVNKSSDPPKKRNCDWNDYFQQVLMTAAITPQQQKDRFARMKYIVSSFLQVASRIAIFIINELELPEARKKIPINKKFGGVAGGDHYSYDNIFFKFVKEESAAVSKYNIYSSALMAQKAAGSEVRALNAIMNASVPGLHPLLSTTIRVAHYVLYAIAEAPIAGNDTLVYGIYEDRENVDSDGEPVAYHKNIDPRAAELAQALATKLHLAPHEVFNNLTKEIATIWLPWDVEIHLSKKDHRYYIIDLARMFPPCPALLTDDEIPKDSFSNHFRPEFLSQFTDTPLSPDTFLPLGIPTDESDIETMQSQIEIETRNIKTARNKLYTSILPAIARHIDLHQLSINSFVTNQYTDLNDKYGIEDLSKPIPVLPLVLSSVASSLSLESSSGSSTNNQPTQQTMQTEIFYSTSVGTTADGFIAEIVHGYGGNLRQLHLVYKHCHLEISKAFLLMHMVARSIRRLLRTKLLHLGKGKLHGTIPNFIIDYYLLIFGICQSNFIKDLKLSLTEAADCPGRDNRSIEFWKLIRSELSEKYGNEWNLSDAEWESFLWAVSRCLSPANSEFLAEMLPPHKLRSRFALHMIVTLFAGHLHTMLNISCTLIEGTALQEFADWNNTLTASYKQYPYLTNRSDPIVVTLLGFILYHSNEKSLSVFEIGMHCVIKPISRIRIVEADEKTLEMAVDAYTNDSTQEHKQEHQLSIIYNSFQMLELIKNQAYDVSDNKQFDELYEKGLKYCKLIMKVTESLLEFQVNNSSSMSEKKPNPTGKSIVDECWEAWMMVNRFYRHFYHYNEAIEVAIKCWNLSGHHTTAHRTSEDTPIDYVHQSLALLIYTYQDAKNKEETLRYAKLLHQSLINQTAHQLEGINRLDALLALGDAYVAMGDESIDQTAELLSQAWELANSAKIKEDSPIRLLRTAMLMGKYNKSRKAYDKAIEGYKLALNVAVMTVGLGQTSALNILLELSMLYLLNKDERSSDEYFQQALSFPSNFVNTTRMYSTAMDLGRQYSTMNMTDKSIKIGLTALGLLFPNQINLRALGTKILGFWYMILKQYKNAATKFIESLPLFSQLEQTDILPPEKQWSQCALTCHSCLHRIDASRTPFLPTANVINLYEQLAKCYDELHDHHSALQFHLLSLHLNNHLYGKYSKQTAEASLALLEFYLHVHSSSSIVHARLQMEIREQTDPPTGEARIMTAPTMLARLILIRQLIYTRAYSEADDEVNKMVSSRFDEDDEKDNEIRKTVLEYKQELKELRAKALPAQILPEDYESFLKSTLESAERDPLQDEMLSQFNERHHSHALKLKYNPSPPNLTKHEKSGLSVSSSSALEGDEQEAVCTFFECQTCDFQASCDEVAEANNQSSGSVKELYLPMYSHVLHLTPKSSMKIRPWTCLECNQSKRGAAFFCRVHEKSTCLDCVGKFQTEKNRRRAAVRNLLASDQAKYYFKKDEEIDENCYMTDRHTPALNFLKERAAQANGMHNNVSSHELEQLGQLFIYFAQSFLGRLKYIAEKFFERSSVSTWDVKNSAVRYIIAELLQQRLPRSEYLLTDSQSFSSQLWKRDHYLHLDYHWMDMLWKGNLCVWRSLTITDHDRDPEKKRERNEAYVIARRLRMSDRVIFMLRLEKMIAYTIGLGELVQEILLSDNLLSTALEQYVDVHTLRQIYPNIHQHPIGIELKHPSLQYDERKAKPETWTCSGPCHRKLSTQLKFICLPDSRNNATPHSPCEFRICFQCFLNEREMDTSLPSLLFGFYAGIECFIQVQKAPVPPTLQCPECKANCKGWYFWCPDHQNNITCQSCFESLLLLLPYDAMFPIQSLTTTTSPHLIEVLKKLPNWAPQTFRSLFPSPIEGEREETNGLPSWQDSAAVSEVRRLIPGTLDCIVRMRGQLLSLKAQHTQLFPLKDTSDPTVTIKHCLSILSSCWALLLELFDSRDYERKYRTAMKSSSKVDPFDFLDQHRPPFIGNKSIVTVVKEAYKTVGGLWKLKHFWTILFDPVPINNAKNPDDLMVDEIAHPEIFVYCIQTHRVYLSAGNFSKDQNNELDEYSVVVHNFPSQLPFLAVTSVSEFFRFTREVIDINLHLVNLALNPTRQDKEFRLENIMDEDEKTLLPSTSSPQLTTTTITPRSKPVSTSAVTSLAHPISSTTATNNYVPASSQITSLPKSAASLRLLSGNGIISEENVCTSGDGFSTYCFPVPVKTGKWFYQVLLCTGGSIRIGWCSTGFHCNSDLGEMIGYDNNSWAYDPSDCSLHYGGGSDDYASEKGEIHQLVSCSLDLDLSKPEIRFYLNNIDQGKASCSHLVKNQLPLYPALSLSKNQIAQIFVNVISGSKSASGIAKSLMRRGFKPVVQRNIQ